MADRTDTARRCLCECLCWFPPPGTVLLARASETTFAFFLVAFDALFDVAGSVGAIFARFADKPEITHHTDNPALLELAIRFAYLIALVAVVKLLVQRDKADE